MVGRLIGTFGRPGANGIALDTSLNIVIAKHSRNISIPYTSNIDAGMFFLS
jgi:hypothetical protein